MLRLIMITGLVAVSSVSAPGTAARGGEEAPDGWQFVAIRQEAAPRHAVRPDGGAYGLVIEGTGDPIVDGRWVKQLPIPQAPYVNLTARYRAANIEMTARNVLAALVQVDETGREVAMEVADTTGPADAQGWRRVDERLKVHPKAKTARIELRLRWSPQGKVEWRDAELKPSDAPAPRRVKVATVHHRPRGLKSAQENLEQFAKWIDDAGKNKADIVCLPEAMTLIGRGGDYLAATEPIPGPSTEFLGKVAARNNAYLVAGLLERDGKGAYNTSVLIDRDGKLLGKYRKVCLPTSEYNGGLAPGDAYPVFDTDFGRIGMMICWDVSYPEVARELAAAGAEMILMPIWGGNETLCRARAIENQVPLVISSYDLRSAIYDQAGEAKAQAQDATSCVVYADFDLAEPMNWKWMGNWRSRIWLEGPMRKDATAKPMAKTAGAKAD
ncbi:MAG: carbon-nitrogen hydrolase family protein [Tepidisphaeraceae bacterium]